ncbi:MAG TPA: HIT domain-containing protein [Candidatus Cloacimonadota bacterium]|nr:HIT domain-containing protein [Candidatus Cloacimonadota bacterium]
MNKDYLYSPWRLDYIMSEKPGDCVLCRVQRHDNDVDNLILHRGPHCYIMLNRYPYNNGHLMVVPYLHAGSINELPEAAWNEASNLLRTCEMALQKVYKCDGINIGINLGAAAGAGIAEHLHIHVVPRWAGDSNFMSVVSGQRVIPEAFETAFDKLSREFAKLLSPKG